MNITFKTIFYLTTGAELVLDVNQYIEKYIYKVYFDSA